MTALDDDPGVTVRLTEQEAVPNLRIVLELCASGSLRCSEKTRRPAATSVTGLSLLLAEGDFYPHEPIAAYAWPLLVQAGSLAELAGNRLQLTTRGRAALTAPPSTTIRDLWRRWGSHAVIDELSRVETIKGQRSANALTAAKTRRQVVGEALRTCPAGDWVSIDELFMRMQRANLSPTVARNERGLWKLYIRDSQYGSLGYAGFHDWTPLEGRYTLAVLFEYAATLGLIDVAYTDPAGARDDFVGWPGGIAPPGSHRTVREPLGSHGSCHPGHHAARVTDQCANSRGYLLVIPCQHAKALVNARNRLYFLRIQRNR